MILDLRRSENCFFWRIPSFKLAVCSEEKVGTLMKSICQGCTVSYANITTHWIPNLVSIKNDGNLEKHQYCTACLLCLQLIDLSHMVYHIYQGTWMNLSTYLVLRMPMVLSCEVFDFQSQSQIWSLCSGALHLPLPVYDCSVQMGSLQRTEFAKENTVDMRAWITSYNGTQNPFLNLAFRHFDVTDLQVFVILDQLSHHYVFSKVLNNWCANRTSCIWSVCLL